MYLLGKVVSVQDNSVNFNINKSINDMFDKLVRVIERINADGYKTNINVHKEYTDNVYISAYRTKELLDITEEDIGTYKRFYIRQTLKPNSKGYINFNVYLLKNEPTHYVNYLDDE